MMNKKFFKWMLAASLVGMLTACGQQAATEPNKGSGKTTITWAVFKDPTPATDKLIAKFKEKNPDIDVKMQVLPAGSDKIHTALVTALGAKDDSIDVVSLDIIWPAEFGAAKWVMPLNKYFTKEEQSKFLKGPLEGVTYKDNIYAVPWYTDAGLLFYRSDIVKEPPKTWEELLKTAKEKKGQNGTDQGFVFQGKQFEGLVTNFTEFLWSNGGKVLDGDKVVVNSPEGVEALQFMVDLVRKEKVSPEGVTTYDTEDSRRPFTEGKAVLMRNWPYVWAKSTEPESKVSGKVGMTPMPKGPHGQSGAATLGGWNVAISQYSKNPDAAWKFIQFITSEEGQKINAIEGGRIPTLDGLFKDSEVLKKNPHFEKLYPVFLASKARPATPQYSAVSEKLQIHIHNALTGQETAQQALDSAAKEIQAVLDRK